MKNNFSFRKATLLAALFLIGMLSNLKAVTTTFAVGPGTYTGYDATYTTIANAYAAIPATITGPYVIELQSDYVPAAAEYPITFTTAKTGASATNSITIRPATGAKLTIGPANQTVIATDVSYTDNTTVSAVETIDLTGKITKGDISMLSTNCYVAGRNTYINGTFKKVTAYTAGSYSVQVAAGTFTANSVSGYKLYFGPTQTCAFKFNGCKYVTIDGVSRTDASTGLTIQNPNCINAQAIMFTNASQYNTVKNCIIRGANQTGANNNGYNGTVYFSGATYTTIANNDICDMNDANIPYPISAIQMTSAGGTNTNQTITNNNIYNINNLYSGNGNFGFLVFGSDANATNNNITYNRFYWTAPTTFKTTTFNILAFATIGSGQRFEGNVFGYGAADGTGTSTLTLTGTPSTCYGFNGLKNSVFKNNTIGGITVNNGGSFVSLQLSPNTAGTVSADSICYGNTIKDITINATNGSQTLYGIFFSSAPNCNVNVKNNVIKNLTISSSTAANAENIVGISHNFAGNVFPISITTTASSTSATITTSGILISGLTYTLTGNNTKIADGTTFSYSGSNSITLSAAAVAAGTGTAFSATAPASSTMPLEINCIGNEVSNLTAGSVGSSANHSINAFMVGGCSNTYDKNLIYNLNIVTSGTGSLLKGMRFNTSKASGILLKNNIFRLGTDLSSDTQVSAISHEALSNASHTFKMYNNTIYIGGTSSTQQSQCFNRSGAISGVISSQNNIFSNVRTGGSAVNQVYNLYAAADLTTTDHNLYQYGSRFANVTTTSPATYAALSNWTSAFPTLETGSIDQQSPNFADATGTVPSLIATRGLLDEGGVDLTATVPDDFYGNNRSFSVVSTGYPIDPGKSMYLGTSDIGAVAFNADFPVVVASVKTNGVKLYSTANNIMIGQAAGKNAVVYAIDGSVVYAAKLSNDLSRIPIQKGIYIVSVDGVKSKIRVQ